MASDRPGRPTKKTDRLVKPVAAAAIAPSTANPGEPTIGGPAPANSLSPEEQMARFAKELKENDWGHQPC